MLSTLRIPALDKSLQAELQQKIDQKTKPPGSLGRLEALALQAGLIQQSLHPMMHKPGIIVFAGDHGVAELGLVNPYPQAVTAQMVYNFLNGGAAINIFCAVHNLGLCVVDAGVNHDFAPHADLVDRKVARGTQNYLLGKAMTESACNEALEAGAALVREKQAAGCNVIGFGEMGIGNSASAALIMHCITGIPLEDCVGAGTGSHAAQLELKKKTLQQALDKHGVPTDALDILATYGGFEIAMICGAILQAAALRMIVVIDGFIVTAALLVAFKAQPAVLDYCVFAHGSHEKGHRAMLDYLGAQPLLLLDLRLGEGTGAALAMPLLQSAIGFLNHMATFTQAGVSDRSTQA
ncbi:nicotinate-nucleotide-dimethylbenzimidazole phosphoribosyltransferase [Chitinophaga costaii]|uniref:Nicotinate-nucleotide--dimethylbenzimidazole phosphoribosyltransferase n=1 Tax=Chitinophaga costaii TaxID=1335309 RepID=A0A1C4F7I5_9BACT|nr:nicotinate-nucleotide--dimethylbenzimidazole phosphoribosyltransferase [Chitinophaga costaii]PUZ21220.1 nicotinate-nucleotide--dimethylbenzimidazole phosphoribosyltransferase [Chitinophaga costaii]SCC51804.1 nicotinate-nucleotide-dimethylbenzimidazole phosphoribosyltransferase [Chitinophaga costaii]